jgi:hypothetical protein
METALVEAPVGDRFINADLWDLADEQVVPLDKKAALEDNGFRVGQLGGIVPPPLQALLQSDRSCVNPRRLQIHAATPASVLLGAALPECRCQLHQDSGTTPLVLVDAQCKLEIVPTLTGDGRTRLRIQPLIQAGRTAQLPAPTKDGAGWVLSDEASTQRFPLLSWEVTLAPNEFVLIGGRFDHPDTLGHQCFIRTDNPAPRQRLLVIRTGCSTPPVTTGDDAAASDDATPPRFPPLALQAAWTTARGCGP